MVIFQVVTNFKIAYKGDFMWSMHSSDGNGLALIIFLAGIIALIVYIYIYNKKHKKSDVDISEKSSDNEEIIKKK